MSTPLLDELQRAVNAYRKLAETVGELESVALNSAPELIKQLEELRNATEKLKEQIYMLNDAVRGSAITPDRPRPVLRLVKR
jgi:hypothetical protein